MDLFSLIPLEIKQKIFINLEAKDICNVLHTSKTLNLSDCPSTWKILSSCHYPKGDNKSVKVRYKIKCKDKDKKQYITLFKTLCRGCNIKTTRYNEFFNINLCRHCEETKYKYNILTYTQAKKNYCLTNQMMLSIKYKNRKNPYNSSRPLKLYLKSDIEKYVQKNKKNVEQNVSKKRTRNIKKSNILSSRYIVFVNIMINCYNFTIDDVFMLGRSDIDAYTNNRFSTYFKYISKKNSVEKSTYIIRKVLELNFIEKYTNMFWWRAFPSFDSLLYFFLIMNVNKPLPLKINSYIDKKIAECYSTYKDHFMRKRYLCSIINQTSLSNKWFFNYPILREYVYFGLKNMKNSHCSKQKYVHPMIQSEYVNSDITSSFYEYIFKDEHHIKNIITLTELEDFVSQNTSISSMIISHYLRNQSPTNKLNLYINTLKSWYNKNKSLSFKIPFSLFKFIL